jgi:hypothetical protein
MGAVRFTHRKRTPVHIGLEDEWATETICTWYREKNSASRGNRTPSPVHCQWLYWVIPPHAVQSRINEALPICPYTLPWHGHTQRSNFVCPTSEIIEQFRTEFCFGRGGYFEVIRRIYFWFVVSRSWNQASRFFFKNGSSCKNLKCRSR